MKKKLDTRFPAARIKKIMQADEDVGKIAMAVPLLVSKALELFLQDLCDRTYAVTLKKGAKTLNSVHLKQCVQTFNVFDFLREIVGRAPDLGGSDATGNDHVVAKRRKVADGEDNSDKDLNRSTVLETVHTSGGGRGRGRGRGGGRPRGSKAAHCGKFEDDPDTSHAEKPGLTVARLDNIDELEDMKENIPGNNTSSQAPVHDFDLNADLDENGESESVLVPASTNSKRKNSPEIKNVELPGWPVADAESMDIDPINLANLNRRTDDDEEDYDDED